MEASGIFAATKQTWRREMTVRDVLSSVMEARPKAGEEVLFREFLDRLRKDDESLIAAARYAFDNSYRSLQAAREREARRKSTTSQQKVAAAKANLERVEAHAKAVKSIKDQIMLLNLPMPNGKPMRNCTGSEMATFGKGFEKIAKKVGTAKRVGEVLSEQQLHDLLD